MDPQIPDHLLHCVLLQISIPSQQLQRIICNIEACIGGKAFRHGCMHCSSRRLCIQCRCSLPHHPFGGLQGRCHVCKLKLRRLKLRNSTSKLFSALDVVSRHIQCKCSPSQRARCNINAPTIQSLHSNFETFSFPPNSVASRDSNAIKHHRRRRLCIPPHFLFFLPKTETRSTFFDKKRCNTFVA